MLLLCFCHAGLLGDSKSLGSGTVPFTSPAPFAVRLGCAPFLFLSPRLSMPGHAMSLVYPGLQLQLLHSVQPWGWTRDVGLPLLWLYCWIWKFSKPVKYTKLWPLPTLLLGARGDFFFLIRCSSCFGGKLKKPTTTTIIKKTPTTNQPMSYPIHMSSLTVVRTDVFLLMNSCILKLLWVEASPFAAGVSGIWPAHKHSPVLVFVVGK